MSILFYRPSIPCTAPPAAAALCHRRLTAFDRPSDTRSKPDRLLPRQHACHTPLTYGPLCIPNGSLIMVRMADHYHRCPILVRMAHHYHPCQGVFPPPPWG
ncbi:unnamed protein product [Chrysoparadoxa australica]